MKEIILFLVIFKICFSFDLKFTDQSVLPWLNKETFENFHSFIILKNEEKNFSASDLNEIQRYTQTSCILMKSNQAIRTSLIFQSICQPDLCPDYMIDGTHGTLAPTEICPLNGKTKEINLFLNNDRNSIYNKMFITIDGCYTENTNGTQTNIYWILSDGNPLQTPKDFDDLYTKFTSRAFFFNNFKRDCSYLCERHWCQATIFEKIAHWIYFILIFVIFVIVLSVFNVMSKRKD